MSLLDSNNCIIIGIDFQEKLVNMLDRGEVAVKFEKLLQAAKILNLPTILTEQYPQGLGATIFDTKDLTVLEKRSFSAMQEAYFREQLTKSGKKQIIIGGIETHICVHQTVAELLNVGYEVFVVNDACASRKNMEHETGLTLMQTNGAKITCLEIVLFELLRTSKHLHFKEIQALIK